MTILHKEKQPLGFTDNWPESWCCIDCGYNTNPGAAPRQLAEQIMQQHGNVDWTITPSSEVYAVREEIWKAAGMEPYGGCLCIGCLETRLGRKLKPKDFSPNHGFNLPGMPCTDRLRDRRGR